MHSERGKHELSSRNSGLVNQLLSTPSILIRVYRYIIIYSLFTHIHGSRRGLIIVLALFTINLVVNRKTFVTAERRRSCLSTFSLKFKIFTYLKNFSKVSRCVVVEKVHISNWLSRQRK